MATVEFVDIPAVVRAREKHVDVLRVRRDIAGFSPPRPVGDIHGAFGDAPAAATAPTSTAPTAAAPESKARSVPVRGQAQRAVVLLRAANVVRHVRGRDHVVELSGREILVRPAVTGIRGNRAAAIVPDHEMRRVVGVDPEVVEVPVRPVVDRLVRGAAVGGAEERRVLHVHDVLVHRIREDVRVVEGALTNRARVVDQRPSLSRVVAREESPVVVLEERVYAVGVRRRDRESDATHEPTLRHAGISGHLGPGLTAVRALEHAAARAAARHLVLLAVRLPQRRIDHVRVVLVDHDIDRAGLVVSVEHLPPAIAPVRALEDAALVAGGAVLAERRHKNDVRVERMDSDLRDPVGLGEADVLPGLARIAASVHAVAWQDVPTNTRLSGADEDHIRIGVADRHRADRRRVDLEVRNRRPVQTRVARFPKTATDRAEVRLVRAPLHAGNGDRSPTSVRSDVAPPIPSQQRGIENDGPSRRLLGRGGRGKEHERRQRNEQGANGEQNTLRGHGSHTAEGRDSGRGCAK